MEHNEKNNVFLLTIVAIVAIVAIVIMIASTSTKNYSITGNVGQAFEAVASSDLDEERAVTNTNPSTITTKRSYCSDTDGGKNYYVRGTVEYSDGEVESAVNDFCRNYNSSTLVEYYCGTTGVASLDYKCPNGCLNGACKNYTVPEPYCGDGIINNNEQCDGTNLGGITCATLGLIGGTLNCYPARSQNQCTFDTSRCTRTLTTNQTGNDTNAIEIHTKPTGANIYIDNTYKGTTPKTITGLNTGNHIIKLTKTGYNTYTTTRFIYPRQTLFLNITLTTNQTNQTNNNWTVWFDRDDGTGSGDYEQKAYFPSVCSNPLAIECYTVSGVPASQTGQLTHCVLNSGFWCLNSENNQTCLDYKVRWLC